MSKKITLNQMKEISKSTLNKWIIPYDNGINIEINPNLSYQDYIKFIEEASSVVDEDIYSPMHSELLKFVYLVKYCSNIPMPKLRDENGKKTNENDLATLYKWMVSTDLLTMIRSKDCPLCQWFHNLECCIDQKIEYKKQRNIHNQSFDKLNVELTELISNINKKVESFDMEDIMSTLIEIAPAFMKFQDNSDLKELGKAIVNASKEDKNISVKTNKDTKQE